jgi:hypothetical protein
MSTGLLGRVKRPQLRHRVVCDTIRVMDEWFKTIAGGLIGGAVAATVPWLKYRDERRDLLRDAYVALFGALERLRMSSIYLEMHRGNLAVGPDGPLERLAAVAGDVKVASARVEFLESSESCLARLATVAAAASAYHRTSATGLEELEQGRELDIETQTELVKARDETALALRDALKELMREAKLAIDRV